MKILICGVQFKGGSLQGIVSIIKELVNFPQHEYYILQYPEIKKQLTNVSFPSNFHFYDIPLPSKSRVLNLYLPRPFFKRKEKEIKPDCVLCTSGPMYWAPKTPCLMGYNLPQYVYPDSPFFKRISWYKNRRWDFKKAFHRFYLKREGDVFFVQTDDVRDRAKKYLKTEKVYTIPNTYNTAYKNPEVFPNKLPERQNDEVRLLLFSSYYFHKNIEIIGPVLDELEKRNVNNIRFVLTLPKEQFEEIAANTKHSERIINVGFVPSKEGPSLYKECDIMFLPTLLECFSASYAEAMIMEKPILTSDLSFAHVICKDAAIYFDPDSPKDIAEKIITLVNDGTLRRDLIEKGKRQLSQFGTSADRTKAILKLLETISKK